LKPVAMKRELMIYFIVLCFTIIIGVLFVYSSLFASELSENINGPDIKFRTHLLGIAIGFFAGFIGFTGADFFIRNKYFMWAMYAFMLGILILALVSKPVNEVHRWFNIGSFQVQPSEYVKFILPAFISFYFLTYVKEKQNIINSFFLPMGLCGIPTVLVFLEPDLSTSAVLFFISFFVCVFNIKNKKIGLVYFIFIFTLIAGAVLFKDQIINNDKFLKPYQLERLAQTEDFQTEQALRALQNGGLLGTAPFGGTMKYNVPVSFSDFIIAVIGEEWGKLGVFVVISLFFFLASQLTRLAYRTSDQAVFSYCATVSLWLVLQSSINAMVGLGVKFIPVTGVTLPLMSYGTNSMVSSIAALGIGMGLIFSSIKKTEEVHSDEKRQDI